MQAGFHTVQRDGEPADAAALAPLAFAGYAHFTAMQVRGGRVRGLDLHLDRLRQASEAMFGRALPEQRIRALLRSALQEGPADVSLVATVYGAAGEFTAAGQEPHVLVRTAAPAQAPAGPLALAVFEHERMLPHIKHVGEVAKTHYLREAVRQGCDDAAFMDRQGRLSEASIWNLAFWDGRSVVWPEGPMLAGVTMQIVRRRLAELDIPQRTQPVTLESLAAFTGAAVMNSWTPGVAVSRIGTVPLPGAEPLLAALHKAYDIEPLVAP
ncbi:aminotransferase class IV family protein [Massilia sp. METH4]|uniref:aminotransferase class IV family protein n=1 Tax=Massilia sp. METH4 TaxID=3123041 RepID=UPI0030D629B0